MTKRTLNRAELTIRFFVLFFLAIVFIVLDSQFPPFKTVRFYLDTLVSPLQLAASTPQKTIDLYYDLSVERQELLRLNKELIVENSYLKSQNLLLKSLEKENDDLRRLLNSPVRQSKTKMIAEVLLIDVNPFSYQVMLDKGAKDGVYDGQPIADDKGLLGQIYQIAYGTSRAILICDYQHAIPVHNLRNDMMMIALGNGCGNDLLIDYVQDEADIRVGDQLVSSGLDGQFPAGYPVATVSSVKVEINKSMPIIHATPTANVKRLRYVLLLWLQDRVSEMTLIDQIEDDMQQSGMEE